MGKKPFRSPFVRGRARAKGLLPSRKPPKPKIPEHIAETQKTIADYMLAHPGVRMGLVAEGTGIPVSIVWRHVQSAFESEGVFAENMRMELRRLGGHMLTAIQAGLTDSADAARGTLALKAMSHIGVSPRQEVTGKDGDAIAVRALPEDPASRSALAAEIAERMAKIGVQGSE